MEEGIAYSGDRWLKMLVVCLAIAACYINVQAYAPILGEIAKGLQVDVGKAGQLFTAVALAAATGLVLGGFVCDRFGITFMLASGLLMTSLTAVLMPWMGHSFTLVFICRLIQGIGTAFVFVTVAPILSSWFPPREHGLTGGLMVGCLSLGSAIGGFVAGPLLAASGTWQKSVAILSIPGWLGIILALWIVGKSPAQRAVSQSLKTGDPNGPTFGKALASSTTWIGILIVLFNASALVNLMAQVQPYLALEAPLGLGLGPVTAGQLALPLFLMGIPAPIVGGIFFEKVAKAKARPAIIIGFFPDCGYLSNPGAHGI
jgi:MFS family permease